MPRFKKLFDCFLFRYGLTESRDNRHALRAQQSHKSEVGFSSSMHTRRREEVSKGLSLAVKGGCGHLVSRRCFVHCACRTTRHSRIRAGGGFRNYGVDGVKEGVVSPVKLQVDKKENQHIPSILQFIEINYL